MNMNCPFGFFLLVASNPAVAGEDGSAAKAESRAEAPGEGGSSLVAPKRCEDGSSF
jgi:hypothetical protein